MFRRGSNSSWRIVGEGATHPSGRFASGLAGGLPWWRMVIRGRVLNLRGICPTVKQIQPDAE